MPSCCMALSFAQQLPLGTENNEQKGHSRAVVCITHDYLSLEEQIDWATLGNRRLKPHTDDTIAK